MAEDHSYSSRSDLKRKFDDPDRSATPPTRRATGFSAPITSPSSDKGSVAMAAPSYNSVPPPRDEIEIAKQRAQEIAARLFSAAEAKRPRVENGLGLDSDKGLGSVGFDQKIPSQTASSQAAIAQSFSTYGYQGSNKKIDIPNGRVGVIIGKGGETIKYLQLQSGAKIQVTRDMDADPNSLTRTVELMGTSEQISKAEQLINDVLAQADAGVSSTISGRNLGGVQAGGEQFQMKITNNKVGLVIGKGGETIKSMQAKSGARIQVIPLHLPPGDTSTERTVYIDGTQEQIEAAKQLVNEVISDIDGHHRYSMRLLPGSNRVRNPAMAGGYPQQGYRPPRPPTTWGQPGGAPPMQQPGYGYVQPGSYPGAPPPQYNMSQPLYGSYPPPASSGFQTGWDQSSNMPAAQQQQAPGTGYDYYNQQQPPQQQPQATGGSSAPADNTGYNYGQPPNYAPQASYGDSTYAQDGSYSGGYYATGPQQGYSQPMSTPQAGYDQQGYGAAANPTQDGSAPGYGAPGGTNQVSPAQQAVTPTTPGSQQGYGGQASYPTVQGNTPSGYGLPPAPQPGYGYGQSTGYGQPPPQGQKPPPTQPVSTQAGYMQPTPAQPGYTHGQQAGYGQQQAYTGAPPTGLVGYGQQQPPPLGGDSYGAGSHSQPPAYSNDNGGGGGAAPGVTKASPS